MSCRHDQSGKAKGGCAPRVLRSEFVLLLGHFPSYGTHSSASGTDCTAGIARTRIILGTIHLVADLAEELQVAASLFVAIFNESTEGKQTHAWVAVLLHKVEQGQVRTTA